jgi:hypothetical protein
LVPLTHPPKPGHEDKTHLYVHEPSQRRFYLRFEDGVLTGYSADDGFGDMSSKAVIETRGYRLGETIRQWLLFWSLIGWLMTFIVGTVVSRFRPIAARTLLVLASACTLCWFLNPAYTTIRSAIASNDNLGWAMIMLAASAGFSFAAEYANRNLVARRGASGESS